MPKSEMLTPREVVAKFPGVPFSPEDLGRLVKLKLLKGYHRNHTTYILISSLSDLMSFRNTLIDKDKVQL
jgi:hypothetical protein